MSSLQLKANANATATAPAFTISGEQDQPEPTMYREAAVQELRNKLLREKQLNTNLLATKKTSDTLNIVFALIALASILALAFGGGA